MRILLAEDDSNIATIARLCLEKMGGHSVVVAVDGALAVQAALGEGFDLILLDGMMPQLDGLQAASEIKKAFTARGAIAPPMIFLTAKSDRVDLERFAQVGDGVIAKPFDPRELCVRIDAILAASAEAKRGRAP